MKASAFSRVVARAAVLILLLGCVVRAEVRTWTDASGKHKLKAELVEFKDGKVRLKRGDGKVLSMSISKLSKSDQQFLAKSIQGNSSATGS